MKTHSSKHYLQIQVQEVSVRVKVRANEIKGSTVVLVIIAKEKVIGSETVRSGLLMGDQPVSIKEKKYIRTGQLSLVSLQNFAIPLRVDNTSFFPLASNHTMIFLEDKPYCHYSIH